MNDSFFVIDNKKVQLILNESASILIIQKEREEKTRKIC